MAYKTGPKIVTDGLIFCVDAKDKTSYPGAGSTWSDIVGLNDGTLTNSPTFNADGYFDFNGSNQYSTHGNDSSLDLTEAITMSSWFNADSTSSFRCWMGKGQNLCYMIFFNGTKIRMRIGSNISANAIDSASDYTTGTWTNVVGTYDGSNMKIYIDGALDQTKARSGTIPTNSVNLGIGFDGATGLHFDGKIATSLIYSRALTANEVLQNFNAQRTRFGV
tara:strand:- start:302 stop:961 length:660 start_codon:yes stop_codon:yes gene_type:complete